MTLHYVMQNHSSNDLVLPLTLSYTCSCGECHWASAGRFPCVCTCQPARDLALFPGCSHLQSLVTCSMQIWKGEAWEIWPHAGWCHCPTKALSCTCYQSRGLEARVLGNAASIFVHDARDGSVTFQHHPPCVYPLST